MNPTKIEWCDETWNPVSGCSKVSQGCKNCYAERVFPRPYGNDRWPMGFVGPGGEPSTRPRRFTDVRRHPERLDQPLRMRKPRRIFVNSMSDLFHEDVPDEFIRDVWVQMAICAGHTFMVLTKRPARMLDWVARAHEMSVADCPPDHATALKAINGWPLRNVWLGVSVEDQATADERIPLLLQTPAAIRFVSYEPALGPVDFESIEWPHKGGHRVDALRAGYWNRKGFLALGPSADLGEERGGFTNHSDMNSVDWIIVGGESGPGARPFDVQWARDVIAQCKAASVPVFVKQLGALPFDSASIDIVGPDGRVHYRRPPDHPMVAEARSTVGYSVCHSLICIRARKGSDPSEWPEDLRVREFPT